MSINSGKDSQEDLQDRVARGLKEAANITRFVRESNMIEGIHRDPLPVECAAHASLLSMKEMTIGVINAFQKTIAPGFPIRDRVGMDVAVDRHIAPFGGPDIPKVLEEILSFANQEGSDPWVTHCRFEGLHPYMDGNGRTGRALWMWQMKRTDREGPFSRMFLHTFCYQTLRHQDRRQ